MIYCFKKDKYMKIKINSYSMICIRNDTSNTTDYELLITNIINYVLVWSK